MTYTQHGQLCIDNNRAERAVKPFVIGRKIDYLATQPAVQKPVPFCIRLSKLQSECLNPVKHVEHLLTEIPKRNADDALEELMHWIVRLGGDD